MKIDFFFKKFQLQILSMASNFVLKTEMKLKKTDVHDR